MKRAGMTWVKKQVRHGGAGGEVIAQAHGQGFKVLIGALGDKQRLAADFNGYIGDLHSLSAALARNGADAIEVWNEPNIDREWPNGQVNGARYVELLKVAYQAIKAANPATLVISGARPRLAASVDASPPAATTTSSCSRWRRRARPIIWIASAFTITPA